MVGVSVFVEGGGDTDAQRGRLRSALGRWLESALPAEAPRPRVVACGSRNRAFEAFAHALRTADRTCLLLVDSESAVRGGRWAHVHRKDGWTAPPGVDEQNLHFMAQAMEAWLCADPDALARAFGAGFRPQRLPRRIHLEEEPVAELVKKLRAASATSRRGEYDKGRDIELLGELAPDRVVARCPHARRFLEVLKAALSGLPPA